MSFFFNVKCVPISQPGYENAQYVSAQNVPSLAYKPQQIQYKPAGNLALRCGFVEFTVTFNVIVFSNFRLTKKNLVKEFNFLTFSF